MKFFVTFYKKKIMELPSIRTTEIPERYKEAVLLENILYNPKNKTKEELAQELIEKQVLINENLKKALIRMDFDVAIEVCKIDESLKKYVMDSSNDNFRNLYKIFKSQLISLENLTARAQTIKDGKEEELFNFLLYFAPELENPGQYIINLTTDHQNSLMSIKEDKEWEIYKFARDNGYKPGSLKEIILMDDVEKLKNLMESQTNFDIQQKVQESDLPAEFVDESDNELTLFDYCCKKGAQQCFDFLLLNGCSYSQKVLVYSVLGRNKAMIEKCLSNCLLPKNILSYAVKSRSFDSFDMVAKVLFSNEKDFSQTDPDSIFQHELVSAFHSSMNIGYCTFFLFLLEQNVSLENSMFYLENPIFVDTLIENMVSPSARDQLDQTPIYVIEDFDTIKELVDKGCDLNLKDKRNKTAINFAASRGEKKKVEFLLSLGAEVENDIDIIRTCIINGDFDIARILLNGGAPIDDQASEKLYRYENGLEVDQMFSEDDDIYAVLEKTPDQYQKGQPEQISSDGYSDFDL